MRFNAFYLKRRPTLRGERRFTLFRQIKNPRNQKLAKMIAPDLRSVASISQILHTESRFDRCRG
jgi:hypothetical protein